MNGTTRISRRTFTTSLATAGIAVPAVAARSPLQLGLSLPLTGVQAEVANDLKLGYELAFRATRSGLALKILDDQSKPERTAENIKAFADDPGVIACSGIVGTPHAQAALPVALKGGLPIVGLRSGAQALRTGQDGVFHLRAGFNDELDKVVSMCSGAGLKQMAILYSNDSFGTSSKDHLAAQLKAVGIEVAIAVAVDREGKNIDQATALVADKVKRSNLYFGVALLLISKPMQQAATSLRETHKIVSPFFAMSFVATKSIATKISPALAGLGLVTAFPLPRTSNTAFSYQYRQDAVAFKQPDLVESLSSYEGYFYGRIVAEAARSGGLSRDALTKHLARSFIVLGTPITFDASKVGFRHLEIVRKSAADGRLRA
jgi:branched-chain amino acid transport system substrate-binding protein